MNVLIDGFQCVWNRCAFNLAFQEYCFNMKLLILILSFAINCLASPNGAPALQSVCDDLTPNHGVAAQESVGPYSLIVASPSKIKGGETIRIEIQAATGKSFKGFFLLTRTNEAEFRVLGEFLADEDEATPFNFRDCSGHTRNAVTHFNNELKEKISLKWKAPLNFEGSIHFR